MADLKGVEFSRVAKDIDNNDMSVGELGSETAEWTVAGASSTQSPVLQKSTKLVRLKSVGGNGVIAYGVNPTALATGGKHMTAEVVEYFGVPGGSNPGRIAFINAT